MAARTTTQQVLCPQLVCAGCGGQAVEATYGKAVTVQPCASLLAQGWKGPQAVLFHSQALELLTPASAPAGLQHREGLVVFA